MKAGAIAGAGEIATQYLGNPRVVNMITTGAKEQVMLKVTVAELQRDALRPKNKLVQVLAMCRL